MRGALGLTPWAGLLLFACHVSESSDRAEWIEWSPIWVAGDCALIQSAAGTVLALDPDTGQEQWQFQLPRRTAPKFAEMPSPRLVCEPISLGEGTVLLQTERHLFALSDDDGSLRYRRPVRTAKRFGSRRCPARFVGGTWLQLDERGERLTRFDAEGRRLWQEDLPAPAVGGPVALSSMGTIVLRTMDALIWMNSEGQVLRARPLAGYAR